MWLLVFSHLRSTNKTGHKSCDHIIDRHKSWQQMFVGYGNNAGNYFIAQQLKKKKILMVINYAAAASVELILPIH